MPKTNEALNIIAGLNTDKRNTKVIKGSIEGLESDAARLVELKHRLENIKAEYDLLAGDMVDLSMEYIRDMEAQGQTVKTVDLGHGVTVTRANRYKSLDTAKYTELFNVVDLQGMFSRAVKASVRPAMLPELTDLLGDDAARYLDVVESWSPGKTWIEDRAALRPSLDASQNELLDGITDQLAYAPSIKVEVKK